MLQHALTIRQWISDLQELAWNITDESHLLQKQEEYTNNMNQLFQQLQKENGMTKQMFSSLTEQAMTL